MKKLLLQQEVQSSVWNRVKNVHDFLVKKSDILDKKGNLQPIGAIACVDDDPFSAIVASMIYHYIARRGNMPKVYCIGGRGLLSKHLNEYGEKNYTEGKRLAHICQQMNVPQANIVIIDKGTNTGANIKNLADYIATLPEAEQQQNILFCLTQRLSLRFERTFKLQFYQQMKEEHNLDCSAKDFYYVIKQDVQEVCCWANGKAAGRGRMLIHEVASIYNRCQQYAGKFQLPLETEVPSYVAEAAFFLEERYGLKLGRRGIKEIFQYLLLWVDLKLHLKDMKREQQEMVCYYKNKIASGTYINWLKTNYL